MIRATVEGRILNNTENGPHNYSFTPANGDKKSFLRFLLSVRKPYAKKDENGYYPTDLLPAVAFGMTAEHINNYFGPNTSIVLSGYFRMSEEFTTQDGRVLAPRWEFVVENLYFTGAKSSAEVNSAKTAVSPNQSYTNTPALRKNAKRAMPF